MTEEVTLLSEWITVDLEGLLFSNKGGDHGGIAHVFGEAGAESFFSGGDGIPGVGDRGGESEGGEGSNEESGELHFDRRKLKCLGCLCIVVVIEVLKTMIGLMIRRMELRGGSRDFIQIFLHANVIWK